MYAMLHNTFSLHDIPARHRPAAALMLAGTACAAGFMATAWTAVYLFAGMHCLDLWHAAILCLAVGALALAHVAADWLLRLARQLEIDHVFPKND